MSAQVISQEYELVRLDRLEPHPENPRRGNLGVLEESLQTNGFYGAVVVQRSTGYVLAGNHRLMAARASGLEEIPVVWADVDEASARRILLVDNRSNDLAGYEQEQLARLLSSLAPDLGGTGYTEADLAELLASQSPPVALTDPDDVPAPPRKPRSRLGDIWLLGPHRLRVGDATDGDDVDAALDGARPHMTWTDPPYGVAYVGATPERLRIANDDLTAGQLGELLVGSFGQIAARLREGGAFYVCSPSGRLETTFRLSLQQVGLELRQQIVWVKDRFVLGRADYHGQHETVLFGWQLGDEPERPPLYDVEHDVLLYGWKAGAAHTFEGGRKQSTVWECARPAANREHPTMKPVALVGRAIMNSSRPGQIIFDPFAGSGSTLIAAHHAGRVAALVELDPVYADVIARRWQEHTGQVPVLEGSGEVDFVDG